MRAPADLDDQGDRRGSHRARGGRVRRAGLLLRELACLDLFPGQDLTFSLAGDRGAAPAHREHEPDRHLDADLGDQLLHPPAPDARQGHGPPAVHEHQRAAGLPQVHRGRQGGRLRAHAPPGPALAELGPPREAQDHHAGPARPDRERAGRPGLRLEPADLQDGAHRDHVQPAPARPRAQRGRVHVHRPRGGRAPERLRRAQRHPAQGPAHGKSGHTCFGLSCTSTPAAASPQRPRAARGSP